MERIKEGIEVSGVHCENIGTTMKYLLEAVFQIVIVEIQFAKSPSMTDTVVNLGTYQNFLTKRHLAP